MVNELKYVLLGLLITIAAFAGMVLFALSIKYYNEATLVVAFLGLSYWASRLVKDYYETNS